jgi:hypothetical protein
MLICYIKNSWNLVIVGGASLSSIINCYHIDMKIYKLKSSNLANINNGNFFYSSTFMFQQVPTSCTSCRYLLQTSARILVHMGFMMRWCSWAQPCRLGPCNVPGVLTLRGWMLDELKHTCIDMEVKGGFLHLLIKSKRETTLIQKA